MTTAPTGTNSVVVSRALELTVHAAPSPINVTTSDPGRTTWGRVKMLIVLLVCAAPVVASYVTYYIVRPEGRRNFGELIDPQRPLPDLAVRQLDGANANLRQLKGQWLLVSVAPAACDSTCALHLYLQRQLITGLGKEKDRVSWVWLVNDEAAIPASILPALKTATVLRVPAQGLAQWLSAAPSHALTEHLYVVDPMGNWMMRFPPNLDKASAPKVKRDLERLLRASAFWDKPFR